MVRKKCSDRPPALQAKSSTAARAPVHICVFLQMDVEYGRNILRGIGRFAHEHPDLAFTRLMKPRAYNLEAIQQLRPDGIIAKVSSRAEESLLLRLGLPVVNVSGQLTSPRIPTVNTDDLLVGRLAYQHLWRRGLKHFAFVGSQHHRASELRLQGFAQAASPGAAATVPSISISHGELDEPTPEKAMAGLAAWVRALPKPVGILSFTDRLALDVAAACHHLKVRVPDDVAILGVGNDSTRLVFPHVEISSIELNAQRIGQLAAELLLTLLGGGEPPRRETLVGPLKIVGRRSTDRLAVGDDVVCEALDLVREKIAETTYVEELARAVGVSRRNLEMRFRQALGTSVYAEVQRLHFERAIELMADRDTTIAEIAAGAGFPSAQTFTTMFKRRFATSPSAYRARLQGETTGGPNPPPSGSGPPVGD